MKEGDEEDAECATCRSLMHTAALECDCCPGRHVCLYHSDTLCECKGDKHRLLYR
jgi:histone demethylase JARID1